MKIFIGKVDDILSNYDNDISCFNARIFNDESKAGLILLKHIISVENLQTEGYVKYGDYHKPYLKGISYNISHSEGLVAVAITKQEVGLDIQKQSPVLERVKEKYFNPKDLDVSLLHLWVIKESYLKYLGIGLTNDIFNIKVNETTVEYNEEDVALYKCYDLDNDFALAVSYKFEEEITLIHL